MLKKKNIQTFKNLSTAILNSYSQIFFSENKLFAGILIFVSFFNLSAGTAGLLAVLISNIAAYWIGYNKYSIIKGSYGFNPLLVGLGLGIYFQADIVLYTIVFFASILTLFITLAMEGVLAKYALPFLSLPFLIGIWVITLSTNEFTALKLSETGIYTYNELYNLGGKPFISIYESIDALLGIKSLRIYFLSLGAIFFQNSVFAGIFIAAGLLYFSRIAFSLSLIGFYAAFLFYDLIGANFSELAYTFIGFNYILTSIAVGAYFIIPSERSYFWTILLLPITVLISLSLSKVFSVWSLSIYSLPFNIIVLLFIYVMKLRYNKNKALSDVFIRETTPEKSLYLNKTADKRVEGHIFFPISLPFWGKWTVSQAHNGEYTHKGNWRHAWDFVIKDNQDKQYNNSGDEVTDYFCYGKTIIAPAAGYVVNIDDGIPDNKIGNINTAQNWGNSIVIKHTEQLYSQISHIKTGSFKVKKGDYIKKGQLIALVGNSGHSPYPHVHFQLQATPYVGSETIDYPLNNFINSANNKIELKAFGNPQQDNIVSPVEINDILKNSFRLIPGQKVTASFNNNDNKTEEHWEVYKTIYNQTYIYCPQTKSTAYFTYYESEFYFTNFTGNKKSGLYYFFISAYQLKTAFYKGVNIKSLVRPNLFFSKPLLFLQDFIAPFYIFIKSSYNIEYIEKDDDFNAEFVKLKAEIKHTIFNKEKDKIISNIIVKSNNDIEIIVEQNNKLIQLFISHPKRQIL